MTHPPPHLQLPCLRHTSSILPLLCPIRDDETTVTPHSEQLNLDRFLSLNIDPPPHMALSLYAASLHLPQIQPGVHIISFVFSRLV